MIRGATVCLCYLLLLPLILSIHGKSFYQIGKIQALHSFGNLDVIGQSSGSLEVVAKMVGASSNEGVSKFLLFVFVFGRKWCLLLLAGLSILIVVAIALLIGACVLCGGLVILKRCENTFLYSSVTSVDDDDLR